MWIFFAFGSALFAGLTAILAKCGIRKTDSTVATAIRTIVVLAFSWLMVFITGSQGTISSISGRTLLFLVLSGLATGASWLCYFRALQLGDVNKVVPIDKSSTVLTILLAAIFLREGVSLTKGIGVVLIAAGTFLMIEKKESTGETKTAAWLWYALGSAVFASLTAILGKVGISGVESNLGTAIRTGVVLVMSWLMVFVTGKQSALRGIPQRELGFICLSGLATGGSWLCYYKALQDGPASVVVPIDKLSILVTVLFSYVVFHEKLTKKSALGLAGIVAGTLLMLVQGLFNLCLSRVLGASLQWARSAGGSSFFHSDRRWFYENGRSSASGAAVSPRTAPMSSRCTRCLPIFSARRTGTRRGRLCVFAAGILRRDVLPGARLPVHPRRLRGGTRRRHRRCDHALRTQMAPVNRKFHAERPAPVRGRGLSAMVMDELSRGWGYASSRFLLPTTAAAARPDTPSAATHSITPRSPVEGLSGFVG